MSYLAEIEEQASQVEECQAHNIRLREQLQDSRELLRDKNRRIACLEGKITRMKQDGE